MRVPWLPVQLVVIQAIYYNNNILSTPESIDAVAPLVHACLDPNDANVFSCSNNQCHTDPGYVNATPGALGNADGTAPAGGWVPGNNANFALQSTSPAINYSQTPPPLGCLLKIRMRVHVIIV